MTFTYDKSITKKQFSQLHRYLLKIECMYEIDCGMVNIDGLLEVLRYYDKGDCNNINQENLMSYNTADERREALLMRLIRDKSFRVNAYVTFQESPMRKDVVQYRVCIDGGQIINDNYVVDFTTNYFTNSYIHKVLCLRRNEERRIKRNQDIHFILFQSNLKMDCIKNILSF